MAISNGSGTVTNVNTYDDYGIPGSANVGRFQYTGQAWLPELGMYYYKARIYSPTLGRFMQTDPIGYGDGLNWYNYVGSDPVNNTDPSGLSEIFVTGTRERPNLCVNCTSRIPLSFDFEPSEFSRVANEKGEGGERIEPKQQRAQPKTCPKGKVLTIGVSVNVAVIFGVSLEGGVAINLSSGRPSLYGAAGKTYGVDISAGIGPGLYKDISALQGSYTEIAAGLLAGSVSGVFNDKKELVGGSFSGGPGLPASARATQGVGGTLGGGC